MREIVGSTEITVDISSSENQGTQLGRAVTSDTSGNPPNKLQRFLKENLKQLGVSEPQPGGSVGEERPEALSNLGWWWWWLGCLEGGRVGCWESHGGGLDGCQLTGQGVAVMRF